MHGNAGFYPPQMAEQYTKEPWCVDGTKALGAYGVWTDYATHPGHDGAGYGSQICSMRPESADVPREQRDANARRICAAVNATAGIPTEALEAGAVKDLLAALEAHDAYMSEQFHDGPVNNRALHPKAAENWQRVRSALAKARPT